jgi:hypothetical protein
LIQIKQKLLPQILKKSLDNFFKNININKVQRSLFMDMKQKLKEVINLSQDGKTSRVKAAVFELLNQKVNNRLDHEKIVVASNMFKDDIYA